MHAPLPTPPETKIICGDALTVLRQLKSDCINCVVTSPPYFGLRDYGVEGQIGLEQSPAEYVAKLTEIFREVRRVLTPDGTCWLNLGDSYANDGKWGGHTGGKHVKALHCSPIGRNKKYTGMKPKDLIGIPWRVAFALQTDGWYLRQDIIWHKPNPMPESVRDRCTKAHEYLFMLTKSAKYFYDADAVAEALDRPDEGKRKTPAKFGGANKFTEAKKMSRYHSGNAYLGTSTGTRNKRSVWTIAPKPYKEAHFATFPPDIVVPCIKAGCPPNGVVLDPFAGAGTTGLVAQSLNRHCIMIELNPTYVKLIEQRLK